jgi:3-phenylpropionate/cinnamic acid dioxygenase small subunit
MFTLRFTTLAAFSHSPSYVVKANNNGQISANKPAIRARRMVSGAMLERLRSTRSLYRVNFLTRATRSRAFKGFCMNSSHPPSRHRSLI